MAEPGPRDAASHRSLAVKTFNRTWELLDQPERTVTEDAEMLTTAFASRYHWLQVGEPHNFSVSDWQVARVAAVLGFGDLAEQFGKSALGIAVEHDLAPFYVGYGHEALARAARLAGDDDAAARHLASAHEQLDLVDADVERDVLATDLAELG